MPLRLRITLLIVVLLAAAIIGNTTLLVLLGEHALVRRADNDGIAISRLLANGVGVAEHMPDVVNAQIGKQMVAEAALAAQLVDLAKQAGLSRTAIDTRLATIVARTGIRRIIAVDRDGSITAGATPQLDGGLAADRDGPLAAAFAQTAPGARWAETLPPLKLPGSSRRMRFAGVRAPGGNGVVAVAEGLDETRALRHEIGPERNISAMVGDAGIEGIWIFGENRNLVARASIGGGDGTRVPTAAEMRSVAAVIRSGQPQLSNDGDLVRVVAPVLDDDTLPIGATLIRFSTAEVRATMRQTILLSVGLALVLLVIGVAAADVLGRRISRPIIAVADAARSVHDHRYDAAVLAPIARRGDEIGSLARDFAEMAQQVLAREEELDRLVAVRTRQLNERNNELTQAIDVIQADLDAARALQHAILPQQFPDASSLAGVAIMTAARHVGGDFYDYFMVDPDHLAVIIADVSGKGVPAALFMAVSRTILHAQAQATPEPGDCLRLANAQICTQNPLDLFITVFYGLLDIRDGVFRYASAGHPPPIRLCRATGRVAQLSGTDGVALGVMDALDYREGRVTLARGDTLVLYTDGVSEAMDEGGNEFTEARIFETLEHEADDEVGAILGHLISDVQGFVKDAPQSDDLTCVVLRYLGQD